MASGRLTQAQADERAGRVDERVRTMVERVPGQHPERGKGPATRATAARVTALPAPWRASPRGAPPRTTARSARRSRARTDVDAAARRAPRRRRPTAAAGRTPRTAAARSQAASSAASSACTGCAGHVVVDQRLGQPLGEGRRPVQRRQVGGQGQRAAARAASSATQAARRPTSSQVPSTSSPPGARPASSVAPGLGGGRLVVLPQHVQRPDHERPQPGQLEAAAPERQPGALRGPARPSTRSGSISSPTTSTSGRTAAQPAVQLDRGHRATRRSPGRRRAGRPGRRAADRRAPRSASGRPGAAGSARWCRGSPGRARAPARRRTAGRGAAGRRPVTAASGAPGTLVTDACCCGVTCTRSMLTCAGRVATQAMTSATSSAVSASTPA